MSKSDDLVANCSRFILDENLTKLRKLIELLTTSDAKDDLAQCLVLAASAGKVESLKLLIELGADVRYRNEDGETAFSFACANNHLDVARILFENGAEINVVDSGGGTPLDWAVCWASPEFRTWLRSVGGVRKTTSEEWPWPPRSDDPQ